MYKEKLKGMRMFFAEFEEKQNVSTWFLVWAKVIKFKAEYVYKVLQFLVLKWTILIM